MASPFNRLPQRADQFFDYDLHLRGWCSHGRTGSEQVHRLSALRPLSPTSKRKAYAQQRTFRFRPSPDMRDKMLCDGAGASGAASQIVFPGDAPAGSDVLSITIKAHRNTDITISLRRDLLNNRSYSMAAVASLYIVSSGSEQGREALRQAVIAACPDIHRRVLYRSEQDHESEHHGSTLAFRCPLSTHKQTFRQRP